MQIKKTISVTFVYDTDKEQFVSIIPDATNAKWQEQVTGVNPPLPDLVILCPNDSDTVTDMGQSPKQFHLHKIMDHHGTCDLYCPVTGHNYKHIIQVPNKNELICRGCGKLITDTRY